MTEAIEERRGGWTDSAGLEAHDATPKLRMNLSSLAETQSAVLRASSHETEDMRHRSRSRSTSAAPPRRSRPVAADFFGDGHTRSGTRSRSRSRSLDESRNDERRRREHRHHHHKRRQRSHEEDDHAEETREHKRRRRGDDRHHKGKGTSSTQQHDAPPAHAELPFAARSLSHRHDLEAFTPLFAYYLDIQKGKDFWGMDDHERRGRWKSFVHKWNRGELAEGWYDPEMFERVARETGDVAPPADEPSKDRASVPHTEHEKQASRGRILTIHDEEDQRGGMSSEGGAGLDDDDDYGPPPPPGQHGGSSQRSGPGMPTVEDLTLRREDEQAAREAAREDLRLARKADRALQRERLDEIVPRAQAGTRERQLEKRALVSEKMRSFKEARADAGGVEEVGDGELMGGGAEDDVQALKRAMAAQQRKKTERELRREAEARARMEEREERLREWREREEEKMKSLKELAKARFG